jgi:hypothetical protein
MGRGGGEAHDLGVHGVRDRAILVLRVDHQELRTSDKMPKRQELGEVDLPDPDGATTARL